MAEDDPQRRRSAHRAERMAAIQAAGDPVGYGGGVADLVKQTRPQVAADRRAALEHYAKLAAGWDFEGWEQRAAARDPAP